MGVSSQGCILFSVQKDCWLWVIKPAEMYAYQILTNSWLVDSAPVTLNVWTIKVWRRSIKETTMGQWRSAFRWSCGRFPVWLQLSFPTVAVTHQKFTDIIWIIVFKDRLCQCFSDLPIYLLTLVVRAICQHTYLPSCLECKSHCWINVGIITQEKGVLQYSLYFLCVYSFCK